MIHSFISGAGEELWEASWRPNPEAGNAQFAIQNKPISGGIKPQQPQASKQAYVPPSKRGMVGMPKNTKLHDEDELPENLKGKDSSENMSKSAAKNKKRREAAKKKKEEETIGKFFFKSQTFFTLCSRNFQNVKLRLDFVEN